MTQAAGDTIVPAGPRPGGDGAPPLVLPHRARAIWALAGAALACLGLAALCLAAIRLEWVIADLPEGTLAEIVGGALAVAGAGLTLTVWAMAAGDLKRIAGGRMDPAGRVATIAALLLAKLLVLAALAAAGVALGRHIVELWTDYPPWGRG